MGEIRGIDSYKLPLRQWMIKQIDSGEYPGLEWIQQGVTFRLPWVKKNNPGWEQGHKIFEAWAKHKDPKKIRNPSQLKSNFRAALSKSESFEEIRESSELNLQTGNYRVYKIRTEREIRDYRKACRLQSVAKNSFAAGSRNNLTQNGNATNDIPVESILSMATNNTNANTDDELDYLLALSPPQVDSFSDIDVSELDNVMRGEADRNNLLSDPMLSFQNTEEIQSAMETQSFASIASKFDIEIFYNNEKKGTLENIDLRRGLRIHHKCGINSNRARTIQSHGQFDERIKQMQEYDLPTSNNQTINKILHGFIMVGITLYVDQLKLFVDRYCQTQVFVLNNKGSGSSFAKIEKRQKRELIDINPILSQQIEVDEIVYLTCGIKPSCTNCIENKQGVWIKITSYALCSLNQMTEEQRSLCLSSITSLENKLQQMFLTEANEHI